MLYKISHLTRVVPIAAVAVLTAVSAVGSTRAGECSGLPVGTGGILINRPAMEPENAHLMAQGYPPSAARACMLDRDRF